MSDSNWMGIQRIKKCDFCQEFTTGWTMIVPKQSSHTGFGGYMFCHVLCSDCEKIKMYLSKEKHIVGNGICVGR